MVVLPSPAAGGDQHRARHHAMVAEGQQRPKPLEGAAEFGQRLALDVVAGARRQAPQPRQVWYHADDLQPDVALDVLDRIELLAETFGDNQQEDGQPCRAHERRAMIRGKFG